MAVIGGNSVCHPQMLLLVVFVQFILFRITDIIKPFPAQRAEFSARGMGGLWRTTWWRGCWGECGGAGDLSRGRSDGEFCLTVVPAVYSMKCLALGLPDAGIKASLFFYLVRPNSRSGPMLPARKTSKSRRNKRRSHHAPAGGEPVEMPAVQPGEAAARGVRQLWLRKSADEAGAGSG